jgi:hypothetical protein
VATRRLRDGWLVFVRQRRPLTVTYQGVPLTIDAGTYYHSPVVANFANGNGALLTMGGWYPLTPEERADSPRPPVIRYGLEVNGLGSWRAVSNLGMLPPQRVMWRRTTGLELVAGTLAIARCLGSSVLTGPVEAAVWRGNRWDMSFGRLSVNYRHLYAHVNDFLKPSGLVGRGVVVALPWWAGPGALVPLGNPNPLRPYVDYGTAGASTPMPGAIGLLSSAGNQYWNVGVLLGGASMASRWAQWSPAWLSLGNSYLGNAPPRYQVPAIDFITDLQQGATLPMTLLLAPVPLEGNNPLSQPLGSLQPARLHRLFDEFVGKVRHGWPTWGALERLVSASRR